MPFPPSDIYISDGPPPVNAPPMHWALTQNHTVIPFNSSDGESLDNLDWPPPASGPACGDEYTPQLGQIITRMQAAEGEVTLRSDGTPALKKRRNPRKHSKSRKHKKP